MSEQLRDLVQPVGEIDPPLDLHVRISERERRLAPDRRPRRLPPALVRVAALAGVVLVVGALALAAHSRNGTRPAASAVAPPHCTKLDDQNGGVVRNGFDVVCGPASAVVRVAGRWQVMNSGRCTERGWMYFGVSTKRDVPHAALSLHFQPRGRQGWTGAVDGEIETRPGAKEAVSGTATSKPGSAGGTFILHGRAGGSYLGSWNCGTP